MKTVKKEESIRYSKETISRIMDILNQIEVKGITNVTGLSAVMNLLNSPETNAPLQSQTEL